MSENKYLKVYQDLASDANKKTAPQENTSVLLCLVLLLLMGYKGTSMCRAILCFRITINDPLT